MPFLPVFKEMPLDLFFFEVSKVCFIFSEILHSTSYSALLRSYTAEIPGGKTNKTQPFERPRTFNIYCDRQTQMYYFQ